LTTKRIRSNLAGEPYRSCLLWNDVYVVEESMETLYTFYLRYKVDQDTSVTSRVLALRTGGPNVVS
jgi:hypothetical protein